MQHSSVIIHAGSLAPHFSVLQVCFQVGVHKCSIYSGGKGWVYVHLLLSSYTWDHCILFHHYFLYFTFKFAAMCTIPVCTLEMFTIWS